MTQEKQVKDLTFKDLAKRARDEAEAFATHIIGEAPKYRTGREVRYYENQSLVVFISGGKQGRYKSFADDQARGDLFDLWRYVRGGTPHDAVMGYKSFAGLDAASPTETVTMKRGPSPEEIRRQEEKDIAERMRKAQWIWNSASETEGRKEGLTYLRDRGITIEPDADTVRFRKLSADDLRKMGVKPEDMPQEQVVSVIFKATNAKGEISAVQQVLTAGGRKVKFDNPKRTNGSLIGSSVKLGDPTSSDKLQMAEGPETALSLYQATGIPTLITLGTSNFTNVDIPDNVNELIVATDMDKSGVGLASSLKAAQHWSARGIERSGIAIPRLSEGDFNDVLQKSGNAAVALAVDKTFFPDRVRNDDVVLVTSNAKAAFHAWMRTGVSTSVRIPPMDKNTGQRAAINLDSAVDESQKTVLLINENGINVDAEYMQKHRADVQIITCDDDADEFLAKAQTPGYVQSFVQKADIYAPGGLGDKEAMAFALRRKDVDALTGAGHKAIAIRPSEIDNIDLGFMAKRKAIVAPLGKGTKADRALCDRLEEAGAQTTRLTWQIFHPSAKGLKIVRTDIPKDYGAAEAVAEGWKGKAMKDLLLISELNSDQISQPVKARPAKQDVR